MTIELVAVAPDGWGLFRTEDGPWLLRPPFQTEHRSKLTESEVARALIDEDFEVATASFAHWGEAARFLQTRVTSSASPQQMEAARSTTLRLLARATADQASKHLDRLQTEIESGRATKALPVLDALRNSPSVSQSAPLLERIAALMQQARTACRRIPATCAAPPNPDNPAPPPQ